MHEVAAYSTMAMTLGLVVARPRMGSERRLEPYLAAFAGVAIMAALGIVGFDAIANAAGNLWRPFVAIGSVMVMTEAAMRLGVLDWWASWLEARATSTARLFTLVFVSGVLVSASLNNDAAILVLTPMVIAMVRRLYPDRPRLVVPFAFAVFAAAGVAPLPVSNPMNMVVADFASIDFNTYAAHMLPIAAAGWLIGYGVLRVLFRRDLVGTPTALPRAPGRATRSQQAMMALLLTVLVAYSVIGYLGGHVALVAFAGALASLGLCWQTRRLSPRSLVLEGVSWQTLAFLLAVLILSLGLRNVGFVDHLAAWYQQTSLAGVGATSAIGSAIFNNHPMSHMNMMALDTATRHGDYGIYAMLIGGDLGPRLLPIGSLAGLLWLEMLRRQGVSVGLGKFIKIGAAMTVPTLVASLGILALY